MDTLNGIRQAAREAFATGRLPYSIGLYRKIFLDEKNEPTLDDVINYGALLRKSKQLKEASILYTKYITKYGREKTLIRNACNCWIELKNYDQSRCVLNNALKEDPGSTDMLLTLGFTELSSGNTTKACKIFENILKIDSNHFDAWFNLGVSKAKHGYQTDALACFQNANKIRNNHPLLKANIIGILQDLKKNNEAREELKDLEPSIRQSEEVKAAEASLLMSEERFTEASLILRELCEHNPLNAKHWINWSSCLKAIKFTVAPKNITRTALLWHPNNIDLQHSFAQSMAEMGKANSYKKSHICWKRSINELSSEHIFSRQFLEISSDTLNHTDRRELARQWEKKQVTHENQNLWADRIQDTSEDRKIRIGYLSADLRNHPVGRFMLPILKNHSSDVEIWCLDSTPNQDWISEQLKEHADHWVNIQHLNGLQAARQIADEQLDILVELGGFTGRSRLDCLVHRPCPIQLSYLGYPAATHLKCIDGWIGDQELFSTLSEEERKAHQLIFIEGGYMAFDPGTGIPEPERSYSDAFRFGCFNHARKLSDKSIDLFCNVLRECPQSRLFLKSISFHEQEEQDRIRNRFAKQGIEDEQLEILDWVSGGLNHLTCYNLIDAALDPFPYGGATTTAEALWMGVPVISRRHSGMAGCLSTSLLCYGEQAQWVANCEHEYLNIAQKLFTRGPRSKEDRIQLRYEMQRSSVGDARRLSRELEIHYRNLQQRISAPSC